jgi:anti-anti-sigma regulatory factor/HAMP domain-containing protein/type II secretory pathway pseudopilin PulG
MMQDTSIAQKINIRIGSRHSLRRTLLVTLSAILLVMIVLGGIAIFVLIADSDRRALDQRQSETAHAAANVVTAYVKQQQEKLAVVSGISKDSIRAAVGLPFTLLRRDSNLIEIVRVGADGHFLATGGPEVLATQDPPKTAWYAGAVKQSFYISDVQINTGQEPYLIMAVSASVGGGLLTNDDVAASRVKTSVIWDAIREARFGESGESYIINRSGHMIAAADPALVAAHTLIDHPVLHQTIADGDEWHGDYPNFHNKPVRGTAIAISGTDWIVISELPAAELATNTQRAIIVLGGGLLLFGILVTSAMTWLLNKHVFQPVEQLRTATIQLASGNQNSRVTVIRQDEIGQVTQAFNEMASTLAERSSALQQLASSLEQQVEERTAELRSQAEHQATLQNKIIHAQATALAELATPLIPITDQVVVMPLIGALDEQRARHVLEALLHGVELHHARVAILDITGVPIVDSHVAGMLVNAAQSLRLLGAKVVLTGIRPEVAQAVISLGIDLSGLVTSSTLQQGIRIALTQGLDTRAFAK